MRVYRLQEAFHPSHVPVHTCRYRTPLGCKIGGWLPCRRNRVRRALPLATCVVYLTCNLLRCKKVAKVSICVIYIIHVVPTCYLTLAQSPTRPPPSLREQPRNKPCSSRKDALLLFQSLKASEVSQSTVQLFSSIPSFLL